MRRLMVIAAGVLLTAAACTAQASAKPVPVDPPVLRCVTFTVSGRPAGPGMPFDEPVTFCGRGLPGGTWQCPAKSPVLGPGSRLACTRT